MRYLALFLALSVAHAQVADELKSEPKDKATLSANLKSVEQKIALTKKTISDIRDATYLPEMYFSLADLYVQKSRILALQKVANNPNKAIADLDFTKEKRPKQDAIDVYQKIYTFFPKYNRRDHALFLKALEHRDLGQFEEMLRTLTDLAKEFPTSPHFGETNIILGDYLFEQKKMPEAAIDHFKKVVVQPNSAFVPLAYFRLGNAYVAKSENENAIASYEKAIEAYPLVNAVELPKLYRKIDVRREALLALAVPYVEVYADPTKSNGSKAPALYFEEKSPDHFAFRTVLSRVGRRLILKDRWREAADVFAQLLTLSTDFDSRFEALQRLSEAKRHKALQVDLLQLSHDSAITIDLLRSSPAQPVTVSQVSFLELWMRDLATRLHADAGTAGSPTEFARAAEAYDDYLSRFPKSTKFAILKLNRAECYFKSNQWVLAGLEYESLARMSKNKKQAGGFNESAIESYTKALQIFEKLSAIDKIRAQQGLRTVGTAWVKEDPKRQGAAAVAFNVANSYYEERNLRAAIAKMQSFIRQYPRNEKVRDAVFLLINSYVQLDDYKGLSVVGDQLARTPGLSGDDQKTIRDSVAKARTKNLQTLAGDFGTREYAENLISMASKYKNTALGSQALFEAFVSLRSKRDPEMFDVGEIYISKSGDSEHAKEVASSMATLALNVTAFDQAARYLALYADHYPKEKESHGFRKTAALLFEQKSDFKKARTQYAKLNDWGGVARMDYALSDWGALQKSSLSSGLPEAAYWHALALWRQRKFDEALPLIKKLAADSSAPAYQSGHAKFLLSQLSLERFRAIRMKSAQDQGAFQLKIRTFQSLSSELQAAAQSSNGRWAIAALYLLGQTQYELGRFIGDSPLPPGLAEADRQAYLAELTKQAKTYLTQADAVFNKCVDAAEAGDIFTHYVDGCRGHGQVVVSEEDDLRRQYSGDYSMQPLKAKQIRHELFSRTQDVGLILQLGDVYMAADQPQMGFGIYSRVLEIEKTNARALASIGVATLYTGDADGAFERFKKALEADPRQPIALWNLAGLYKHFGFNKKAEQYRRRAGSVTRPALLHPFAR